MTPATLATATAQPLVLSPAATAALQRLEARVGPLVIHHGLGCHNERSLVAYPRRLYRRSPADIHLDTLEGIPVFVDPEEARLLAGRHAVIHPAPCADEHGMSLPLELADG